MFQNELSPNLWATKKKKRLWRWISWWQGKTCWRWWKWQTARKSWGVRVWFEWWQTPLAKRLPKIKWFKNRFSVKYDTINVSQIPLSKSEITSSDIYSLWILKRKYWVIKVLWFWEISHKVVLKVEACSNSAKEKIEKAWWSLVVESKKITKN